MPDKKPTTGSQSEKQPGFGNESGMGDILSVGLRYGIPLAYLAANQHQIRKLRKQAQVDLQAPQLNTGVVRDMARPNFALPSSPESGGSSLAEYMNYNLSRDAIQQANELNFEMQNAQSRIQQENQVLDRTNQNILNQANTQNQEELFNAQLAAQELLGQALPDRTSTIESIFHNLDRDIYSAGVVKDTKEIYQAQEIIRNPDVYSPEQNAWARSVLSTGSMPMKRKGGKITKFSMSY